jgi:hypothetical protein
MEELLHNLYYDPETGYTSGAKLYVKAKEIDKKITMKLVKEFLDEQATHQITKQVKKNKEYSTIISPSIRNNYQMDIFYNPHPKQNKNYKYLLTCIDVYSRYAFVKPMKTKAGDETFQNFKEMCDENGLCKNLNIDEGKEFQYKPFINYCVANNITYWVSNPEQTNKNSIIERFHRTLRNIILRYEVANGKSYIDDLQKLISNYNNTEHRTTEAKPIDIWKDKAYNHQDIKKVDNPFSIGDKVRHLVGKKVFDKNSSTTTYTKKIYNITKIIGQSIYLDDLTKPFKAFELVKAVGEDKTNEYDANILKDKRDETIERRMKKSGLVE